jgi:type VII secretion integral membrane protein EccD
MTLSENGMDDGDLVLLTTDVDTPTLTYSDISRYVVGAAPATTDPSGWSRLVGRCCWLWSACVGAAILGWPSHQAQASRAVMAAIVAVTASVAAVVGVRAGADSSTTVAIGAAAAAYGAVAGYLMVPGGPTPPNFLLAAAICCATATVVHRVTACGPTPWMAIGAFTAMVAISAAAATIWPMSPAAAGSLLASASLAMLAGAAKLSIVMAGLSPQMPTGDDSEGVDATVPATVGHARATRGHEVLTGLLAGFSLAAASGAALAALCVGGEKRWAGILLAVTASIALTFRASQQRGTARSATMSVAALIGITASLASALRSSPDHAVWTAGIAVAVGSAAWYLAHTQRAKHMSPLAWRGLQAADCVALAAVVPAACWTAGVFDLIRGVGLS